MRCDIKFRKTFHNFLHGASKCNKTANDRVGRRRLLMIRGENGRDDFTNHGFPAIGKFLESRIDDKNRSVR